MFIFINLSTVTHLKHTKASSILTTQKQRVPHLRQEGNKKLTPELHWAAATPQHRHGMFNDRKAIINFKHQRETWILQTKE